MCHRTVNIKARCLKGGDELETSAGWLTVLGAYEWNRYAGDDFDLVVVTLQEPGEPRPSALAFRLNEKVKVRF